MWSSTLTAITAKLIKLGLSIVVVVVSTSTVRIAGQGPSKQVDTPDITIWRIDKPEVNAISRDYPEVQFQKYDEVIVRGGGCVNTNGILPIINQTWKRYINPSGDNTDRLYHGRISIPGATAGLVRISWIEGQHLVVNKFPSHLTDDRPLYLTLGYEDDHYDNLYEADDADDSRIRHKATGNQCALEKDREAKHGNAWLEITIKHHENPEQVLPRNPIPRAPLDLWWDVVDENYLPLNPDWWMHQTEKAPDPELPDLLPAVAKYPNSNDHGHCDRFREGPHDFLKLGRSPKCTMQDPDVDEANLRQFPCHFGGLPSSAIHGHANWAAVTYAGHIYFDVANNGAPHPKNIEEGNVVGDGDYDWLFVTEGDRGLSVGNVEDSNRARLKDKLPPNPQPFDRPGVRALALEFSSRETIDHFEGGWWEKFHWKVDHDPKGARDLVWGKSAIATGLIGFDNEHGTRKTGARVELHPVYGLAIKDDSETKYDIWAIFARNWGNEGFCSNGFDVTGGRWQHYLPLPENKMTFFLPANLKPDTAITADFHAKKRDGSPRPPQFTYATVDGGILLTIELGKPEDRNLFWGELHIPK